VNTYDTDEEKVEAIKNWWKDNGTSVITGVVIGLGAVFGWRAWVDYQDRVGQQASSAFEQLMASVETGQGDSARKQADALAAEHGSTAYAALAAMVRARVELDAGNPAAARGALEQAIAQAPDPAIAQVAALRLARVLVGEGDLDAATAVIDKHAPGSAGFAADYDALRGDIAAARGKPDEAREAYTRAIAAGAANTALLQLKLDNLPPAS
jgi:predicted negative regulator of RcsB-dependent stress response